MTSEKRRRTVPSNEEVIVDGRIVTSRTPRDLAAWMRAYHGAARRRGVGNCTVKRAYSNNASSNSGGNLAPIQREHCPIRFPGKALQGKEVIETLRR
jgi:hypothetical protein